MRVYARNETPRQSKYQTMSSNRSVVDFAFVITLRIILWPKSVTTKLILFIHLYSSDILIA